MENGDGDVAQLMPPVAVSANGVLKIISTYRTGTSEVQQFLGSECNIILECKKCQSLYRSVANFISHKRNYCNKNTDQIGSSLQNSPTAEAYAKIETINVSLQRKDIDHIVGRLSEKAAKVCNDGVIGENREATERVQYFTSLAEAVKERRAARREQIISLTPLPGTSKAVAVCVSPKKVSSSPPKCAPSTSASSTTSSVETSVEDLSVEDKKKSRGRPRKISLDQKSSKPAVASEYVAVFPKTSTSTESGSTMVDKTAPNYCCEKCHAQFTSQKSLNLHESTQHMTTRMQYKCPCCKNSFCNLWSTYRHLKSIHRKTQEQVERMKPVIRKRAFKMTVPVFKPMTSTSSSPQSSRASSPAPPAPSPTFVPRPKLPARSLMVKSQEELDKSWVGMDNNFTVDVGDHRCGVCGLRFERRAALISHTNTCHRKPTSSNANKSSNAKSPRSGSPCVDIPPIIEKIKPEGAANRKSSTPVRIIRGPKPIEMRSEVNIINKSPIKTPEKMNSSTKSDISLTNVKENKISTISTTITNKVPINETKINKVTNNKSPIKNDNNKVITNGFQKITGKKSPIKVPQSMNPVVKLVYTNKGLIKPFPQQRRASPNIIKKSTAKVYTSQIANKKLAETIKDSIKSKSTLVNNVTTQLLDKNKMEETTTTATIINGGQHRFIKLTPVSVPPNSNNGNNRVNIKTILPFNVKNSVKSCNSNKILNSTTTTTSNTNNTTPTKLNPSPIKTEPQKAEIIVRTVSDKNTINNNSKQQQQLLLQNQINTNIVKNVLLNQTDLSPDKSDINNIKSDNFDEKSRSSTSSIEKTPEKGKSGIQIRRDYGKISLAESETSSSRPGSVSAGSEDEEFNGWDGNNEDDYQGKLGLPQINNMNHVYKMISVDNDTPYSSESESSCSPIPESTTPSSIEPSPVKTRGMRESEAKRRKIDM